MFQLHSADSNISISGCIADKNRKILRTSLHCHRRTIFSLFLYVVSLLCFECFNYILWIPMSQSADALQIKIEKYSTYHCIVIGGLFLVCFYMLYHYYVLKI